MIEEERIVSGQVEPEEVLVDNNLRPRKLGQYIGQELVKKNLDVFIRLPILLPMKWNQILK